MKINFDVGEGERIYLYARRNVFEFYLVLTLSDELGI